MKYVNYRVVAYAVRVRSLRKVGAVLLLLVSFVAPAMACIAPDAEMTVEERACCRMMKNDCGQMEMPSSSNCCKTITPAVFDHALKADPVSYHAAVFMTVWVASFEFLARPTVIEVWLPRPEHSPPKSPPSIISALRV